MKQAKAAPKPRPPMVVKVIPPVEKKAPELTPVAAVEPAPRNDPPPPANDPLPPPADPNSVLGWGPWTGDVPGVDAGAVPAAGGNSPPRVEGLTPSLGAASPPPLSASSIRPGHGFGDRNHIHIHKR